MPASSKRLYRPGPAPAHRLDLPAERNPIGPKYDYKIKWMKRLSDYARERLALEEPLVLAGDLQRYPTGIDVHNPELWGGDALFLPETRAKFRALINLGLTDALRANTMRAALYVLGLSGRRLQKNNASASIICCSPRRPPTGW